MKTYQDLGWQCLIHCFESKAQNKKTNFLTNLNRRWEKTESQQFSDECLLKLLLEPPFKRKRSKKAIRTKMCNNQYCTNAIFLFFVLLVHFSLFSLFGLFVDGLIWSNWTNHSLQNGILLEKNPHEHFSLKIPNVKKIRR